MKDTQKDTERDSTPAIRLDQMEEIEITISFSLRSRTAWKKLCELVPELKDKYIQIPFELENLECERKYCEQEY